MKLSLILSTLFLFSCSSVDRFLLSKKSEPVINPKEIDTLYIGRLNGDHTGEFKALITERLIDSGIKVGDLPTRNDGISTFFNQIDNPSIDIKRSAILSGSIVINRRREVCTSNSQITCLSSVGIANIIIKRAKDNSVLLSESFRVSLNNRQALVDTQNQALYSIEYDTRRMLTYDISRRLEGYSKNRLYPLVTSSKSEKVNKLGDLIAQRQNSEAKSLFTNLFKSRSGMDDKAHDELLLNGSVLSHLLNDKEEAKRLSELSKTEEFSSQYYFLGWR